MLGGPQTRPSGQAIRGLQNHKLEKIVAFSQGKQKYPAGQCRVCTAHKTHSEICKFCHVPLHKVLALRDSIHGAHLDSIHADVTQLISKASSGTSKCK
jgi:hypothetical protein